MSFSPMMIHCPSCLEATQATLIADRPWIGGCTVCRGVFNDPKILVDEPATLDGAADDLEHVELPSSCRIETLEVDKAEQHPARWSDTTPPAAVRIFGPAPPWPLWLLLAIAFVVGTIPPLFLEIAIGAGHISLAIFTLPAVALYYIAAYVVLMRYGNRPVLVAADTHLSISRRPLPARTRHITTRLIRILFSRASAAQDPEDNGYEVVAVLTTGERVTLMPRFAKPEQALRVQRVLAHALGVNRP